jgi:hypothetical protein
LLTLWDRASACEPVVRPIALLSYLAPDEALLGMTVGERDRSLMLLRKDVFGDRIEGVLRCPACTGVVELSFSLTDLMASIEPPTPIEPISRDGFTVEWRVPSCGEIVELTRTCPPQQWRERLIERCVMEIAPLPGSEQKQGASLTRELPTALAKADPFGDIRLSAQCPECDHAWESIFDIASFFWIELDRWAKRMMQEIHSLAASYGWSESEVLAVPRNRRRVYLEMLGA